MIILILTIIAIIIAILFILDDRYDSCILFFTKFILSIIFATAALITLISFILCNIDADATKDALIVEQSMLNKQIEDHWYNNLTENGKRDLVAKIEEYNKGLAYSKKLSHNKYVGILIPNIYDDIDYINID